MGGGFPATALGPPAQHGGTLSGMRLSGAVMTQVQQAQVHFSKPDAFETAQQWLKEATDGRPGFSTRVLGQITAIPLIGGALASSVKALRTAREACDNYEATVNIVRDQIRTSLKNRHPQVGAMVESAPLRTQADLLALKVKVREAAVGVALDKLLPPDVMNAETKTRLTSMLLHDLRDSPDVEAVLPQLLPQKLGLEDFQVKRHFASKLPAIVQDAHFLRGTQEAGLGGEPKKVAELLTELLSESKASMDLRDLPVHEPSVYALVTDYEKRLPKTTDAAFRNVFDRVASDIRNDALTVNGSDVSQAVKQEQLAALETMFRAFIEVNAGRFNSGS